MCWHSGRPWATFPKGGILGLLPSPGERLSGHLPFSWRIRHVSGAKGIASRFPRGGGGARSALKSRGRRLCHRPRLFVWQAGGPKAPRPPNAAAPGAAAAFSIPGDTLPPGRTSRRFPGPFPDSRAGRGVIPLAAGIPKNHATWFDYDGSDRLPFGES